MAYTANITGAAGATSIRDLINGAVPGEIPSTFGGRCFLILLTPAAGSTLTIVFKAGAVGANEGAPLLASSTVILQSPTSNQLSIDEIFIAGGGTAGVVVITL